MLYHLTPHERIIALLNQRNYENYMAFLAKEEVRFCKFVKTNDVDDFVPEKLYQHLTEYFAALDQGKIISTNEVPSTTKRLRS